MNRIHLTGCRVQPLGDYLKALGVMRLVASQTDSDVLGEWHGDKFVLTTRLTEGELIDFFADEYRPTPIVSPWNGGSGFGDKDQQAGISAIEQCQSERFVDYRRTIELTRQLVSSPDWPSGKDAKSAQVQTCRSNLPDEAVEWLDAAVVLTGERAVFPPIFGTGGNDGRLDFSNNFMQRLAEMLISEPRRGMPDPRDWLRDALFGGGSVRLLDKPSGQYLPNSTNPETSSTSGTGTTLSNPWSFVLLIEGGLLFASGAARRLGASKGTLAAMPFCVGASAVGHGSSAVGEESRGEIWAPIWRRPASLPELSRLLGEGRASWRGRDAGSGVDFAKAVASLGVDRGLDRFVRHGLVQRFGLSFLAVPLGEVTVGARPEVRLFDQVDAWVSRLPRELPAAASSARRRLESAQFRAAAEPSGSTPTSFQEVLRALADLEAVVSRSTSLRKDVEPVGATRRLPAGDWLPRLDDGSPEFRLAASLASARDRFSPGELEAEERTASSLALYLRPIELDGRGRVNWRAGAPRVDGMDRRPLEDVLSRALDLRCRDVQARTGAGEPAVKGPAVGWHTGLAPALTDVIALCEGRVDLVGVRELFRGMLLLDWRRRDEITPAPSFRSSERSRREWTPPEVALLLPFFQIGPLPSPSGGEVWLRPGADWARLLGTGGGPGVERVLSDALARLRISGCGPAPRSVHSRDVAAGPLLAAASLLPLGAGTAARLLGSVCPHPGDLVANTALATSTTDDQEELT